MPPGMSPFSAAPGSQQPKPPSGPAISSRPSGTNPYQGPMPIQALGGVANQMTGGVPQQVGNALGNRVGAAMYGTGNTHPTVQARPAQVAGSKVWGPADAAWRPPAASASAPSAGGVPGLGGVGGGLGGILGHGVFGNLGGIAQRLSTPAPAAAVSEADKSQAAPAPLPLMPSQQVTPAAKPEQKKAASLKRALILSTFYKFGCDVRNGRLILPRR